MRPRISIWGRVRPSVRLLVCLSLCNPFFFKSRIWVAFSMKIIGAVQYWYCWMCWVCFMCFMCFTDASLGCWTLFFTGMVIWRSKPLILMRINCLCHRCSPVLTFLSVKPSSVFDMHKKFVPWITTNNNHDPDLYRCPALSQEMDQRYHAVRAKLQAVDPKQKKLQQKYNSSKRRNRVIVYSKRFRFTTLAYVFVHTLFPIRF